MEQPESGGAQSATKGGAGRLKLSARKFFDKTQTSRIAVIDTEATGSNPKKDDIIEIGAVAAIREDSFIRIERFQRLVKTKKPISPAAAKKTGLTLKMLHEQGSPPSEALNDFAEWMMRINPSTYVAHKAIFDDTIITRNAHEYLKSGINLPEFTCTRHMAKAHLPELGEYTLDALAAHYGVKNPRAHRALPDAETAAICFFEMAAENPSLLDEDYIENIMKYRKQFEAILAEHVQMMMTIKDEDADAKLLGVEAPNGLALVAYGMKRRLHKDMQKKHEDGTIEQLRGKMVRQAYFMDWDTFEQFRQAEKKLKIDWMWSGTCGSFHEDPWELATCT